MLRDRYRRIITFFARVLVSLALWELILPRLGFRKLSNRTRPKRLRRSAAQFRSMAVHMGGVMIKVGQFLSARVDVLPDAFIAELAGLQDEVPAEDFADIRSVAEDEFGMSLEARYLEFEDTPVAAASLGQAHHAKIRVNEPEGENNGEPEVLDVVVKIQRPHIEDIISIDLAALDTVGRWLQCIPLVRRRANIPALLAEFRRTLYEEIDYLAEGRNAETFAENFKDQPGVLVPKVVWSHTTKRVLTLEDVMGIKITDYDAISAAGIKRSEVATRLLNTYLKQIFEDGFFHADPHPGNLFVSPIPSSHSFKSRETEAKKDWQLTFVDFGMAGRVQPGMRAGMRELLIGVGTRDISRVIEAWKMLGVLLPGADLTLIEKAEREMFDRFWGKSMSELQQISLEEMHTFAKEFRELIYTLPFQIPQDIIFLGRAVGILSGMCTGLDPDFNVFHHIVPYAQKLVAEEGIAGWETWFDELVSLVRRLISLPRRTEMILGKIERGELEMRVPQLIEQVKKLEVTINRVAGGIIFTAFVLGGVQLYLAGEVLLGAVLGAGAVFTLLWIFITGKVRPKS